SCCPGCHACLYHQKVYAHTHSVPTPDPCNTCTCNHGSVVCDTVRCPEIHCVDAHLLPDHCCPTCTHCHHLGTTYQSGSEWWLEEDPCVKCRCESGSVTCVSQAGYCNPQCP
ncbi:hypothetical protein OTU49_016581, partial [Cherax quadricarinatus]